MPYLLLMFAIAVELVGTTLLKSSDGFTRLAPTVGTLTAYTVSFVLLAQAVRSIPVGVAYAIWAGVGTASIVVIAAVFLDEPLSPLKVAGVGCVVLGVVVLHLGGTQ